MLTTASSRIVVNGCVTDKFMHACRLRHGDSISQLLFVIAMETLTTMMVKAHELKILEKLNGCKLLQRLSLYADDVVLFIRPSRADITFVKEVLVIFGKASGLHVNFVKSSTILIPGEDHDEEVVTNALPWKIDHFPCKYLGLQLGIKQLTRSDWQFMVDGALKILPGWQIGLVTRPGRWEWLRRMDDCRPWQGLNLVLDKQVQGVFNRLVTWEISGGKRILLWKDRWVHGNSIAEIAPGLVAKVKTRTINARLASEGLYQHEWTNDIPENLPTDELAQFIHLWKVLMQFDITPSSEDKAVWA
ncbi:Serine/threonine-phosphatase BSL2-like protein [Hordeum vulgare]|nr:Serine/threonine-phosphatase BSL2-like protein [Hordeum vulgare]